MQPGKRGVTSTCVMAASLKSNARRMQACGWPGAGCCSSQGIPSLHRATANNDARGGCSTSGQPRSTETPQRQTCFTQTGGLVILCTHASCQHESCQQTHMLGGCWMRSPLWQLLSPEVLTLATPSQHPLAWRRIMCWPVKAQVDQCSKTDEFQCAGLRLCEPPACV